MGTDCPYYEQGFTESTLVFKDGNVVAILGPFDENFLKKEDNDPAIGSIRLLDSSGN